MQSSNYPPLPTANMDTLFSFYPYHLSARTSTHASLRGPPAPEPPRAGLFGGSTSSHPKPSAGPSQASPLTRNERRQARSRAEKRALRARRPAGAALGADAMDLSDEEAQLDEEKHELTHFGHRFLIPIGRRITQMESEAAPSPTPSDHEQRQEDRNGVVSPSVHAEVEEEGEEEEVIDLDASIDDLDASRPEGASTEYDSDDLRLMNAMDRSVGSRTPGSDEADMEEG